jgi:hypothetical protein
MMFVFCFGRCALKPFRGYRTRTLAPRPERGGHLANATLYLTSNLKLQNVLLLNPASYSLVLHCMLCPLAGQVLLS